MKGSEPPVHTCQIIAFILLAVAATLGTIEKTYVAALIAAGLATALIPATFQLTT